MKLKDIPALSKVVDIGYTMILVILVSAVVGLILAIPVELLWNYVFGKIYEISWLQAWALNVLTSILVSRGSEKN